MWYLIGIILFLICVILLREYVSYKKSQDINLVTNILNKTYMDVAQTYLLINRIDLSEAFQNDDETGRAFTNLKSIITYLWKEINKTFITDEEKDVEWLLKQLDDITNIRIKNKKVLESLTEKPNVHTTNSLIKKNDEAIQVNKEIKSILLDKKE